MNANFVQGVFRFGGRLDLYPTTSCPLTPAEKSRKVLRSASRILAGFNGIYTQRARVSDGVRFPRAPHLETLARQKLNYNESQAVMIYHIYTDESRQSAERFMVLGGLIIAEPSIKIVRETMQKYRDAEQMHAELKWTKVTRQKLPKYTTFVDYFFALNNRNIIHLHSIILDSHQFDHHRFNAGDKDLGYYKFLYQLLLHCFGKHYHKDRKGNECSFVVHPDQRTSSHSLEELRMILNNGMAKRFDVHTRPFVSIQPQDSKKSDIAQLNDIIIGAIGFQKNGVDLLAGTRKAKIDLANHIAAKAGIPSLKHNTRFGWNRFKIWNFRLQK